MPRHSREQSGTGIYHVMLRGVNRQSIFEDDEDYIRFRSRDLALASIMDLCPLDRHSNQAT